MTYNVFGGTLNPAQSSSCIITLYSLIDEQLHLYRSYSYIRCVPQDCVY